MVPPSRNWHIPSWLQGRHPGPTHGHGWQQEQQSIRGPVHQRDYNLSPQLGLVLHQVIGKFGDSLLHPLICWLLLLEGSSATGNGVSFSRGSVPIRSKHARASLNYSSAGHLDSITTLPLAPSLCSDLSHGSPLSTHPVPLQNTGGPYLPLL